jgi:DNA-binding CsgD family transcriptional regulator/tetratricopeptide (TPR) repeat protein
MRTETKTDHIDPFVGRGAELAAAVECFAAATAGHGTVLVIEGEPGIGKTRLLAEATTCALHAGFMVMAAGGYELGVDHPYGAIARALDVRTSSPHADAVAIARLLRGDPGEVGQGNLEYRLLDDIGSLVESRSLRAPVLLVMDDLQWVDSPSLLALAHIARALAQLRAALIVAARPSPRPAAVEQWLRTASQGGRWLQLGPLPEEAVAELVGGLVGGPPGDRLLQQIAGGGGSPLLVRELATALGRQGSLSEVDGRVELTGQALPLSFRRLVRDRLLAVPAATGALLRVASVLGSPFTAGDLAAVAGIPASSLAEDLEPAIRQGLLGEADGRLAFRHQLVREVVYEEMPNSLRAAMHGQAGRALAGAGADPAQVATHLSMAGDADSSLAVEWLRRAAREAVPRSPQVAVELLDRAIMLGGLANPGHDEMLAERALALTWAGRAEEAAQQARAMLAASPGGLLEQRLRLALAQALLVQGRWAESAQDLETLAARAGTVGAERGRLLGDAALARAHLGDLKQALSLAQAAARIGEQVGDELTRSVALSSRAVVAHFEARHLDSVEASREALALALRSRSPEATIRPTAIWLGLGLADADQFDEALGVLQMGRRRSEEAGMYWQLPLYHDGVATIHFYAGDWDDAVAELETGLALARERGTLWWVVPANCMLAYMAIHRDHDSAVDEALAAGASQAASPAGGFGSNRLRWVTALRHEARGELGHALTLLEAAWESTTASGLLPDQLTLGPDLVRVALAAGDRAQAREVAGTMGAIAIRTRVRSVWAIARRCHGLVEEDSGALQEAVAALECCPRRVELAFAREDLGAMLLKEGRTSEGTARLDEALLEYRRIGARRDANRAIACLRAAGVRRTAPDRSARAALGWEALTRTELRVTELVRQGLTNPEIAARLYISRRTVDTHLANVFAKLRISSRVELAAMEPKRSGSPPA